MRCSCAGRGRALPATSPPGCKKNPPTAPRDPRIMVPWVLLSPSVLRTSSNPKKCRKIPDGGVGRRFRVGAREVSCLPVPGLCPPRLLPIPGFYELPAITTISLCAARITLLFQTAKQKKRLQDGGAMPGKPQQTLPTWALTRVGTEEGAWGG